MTCNNDWKIVLLKSLWKSPHVTEEYKSQAKIRSWIFVWENRDSTPWNNAGIFRASIHLIWLTCCSEPYSTSFPSVLFWIRRWTKLSGREWSEICLLNRQSITSNSNDGNYHKWSLRYLQYSPKLAVFPALKNKCAASLGNALHWGNKSKLSGIVVESLQITHTVCLHAIICVQSVTPWFQTSPNQDLLPGRPLFKEKHVHNAGPETPLEKGWALLVQRSIEAKFSPWKQNDSKET